MEGLALAPPIILWIRACGDEHNMARCAHEFFFFSMGDLALFGSHSHSAFTCFYTTVDKLIILRYS